MKWKSIENSQNSIIAEISKPDVGMSKDDMEPKEVCLLDGWAGQGRALDTENGMRHPFLVPRDCAASDRASDERRARARTELMVHG